jgi:hypothetical protein
MRTAAARVNISVSPELKDRMARASASNIINWSAFARHGFETALARRSHQRVVCFVRPPNAFGRALSVRSVAFIGHLPVPMAAHPQTFFVGTGPERFERRPIACFTMW